MYKPHLTVAMFDCFADAKQMVAHFTIGDVFRPTISVLVKPEVLTSRQMRDNGRINGGDPRDLNALLIGCRPVERPQLGRVLMAGPIAQWLRQRDRSLKWLLLQAGVGVEQADMYCEGVRCGKVLVAIHHDQDAEEMACLIGQLDEAPIYTDVF